MKAPVLKWEFGIFDNKQLASETQENCGFQPHGIPVRPTTARSLCPKFVPNRALPVLQTGGPGVAFMSGLVGLTNDDSEIKIVSKLGVRR